MGRHQRSQGKLGKTNRPGSQEKPKKQLEQTTKREKSKNLKKFIKNKIYAIKHRVYELY